MLRALAVLLSLAIAAGTAAQPGPEAAKKPAAKAAAKAAPKTNARPAWAELNAEQQQVLEPLKADLDLSCGGK